MIPVWVNLVLPLVWLLPAFLVAAALYSSVGHGGATAYVALLVLAGYGAPDLASTILVLNVLAAVIAFVHFQQAGHLRPRLAAPFLLAGVPAAYGGGHVEVGYPTVELILGIALLAAALRFLFIPIVTEAGRRPTGGLFLLLAVALGAALGFLAGLTGIGGGIFLSPILVLAGWANVKEAGSVAGAFIALNSLAGLAARLPRQGLDVAFLLPAAAAVVVGALVGGYLGARRLPSRRLQRLLGLVLLVAVLRVATDLLA